MDEAEILLWKLSSQMVVISITDKRWFSEIPELSSIEVLTVAISYGQNLIRNGTMGQTLRTSKAMARKRQRWQAIAFRITFGLLLAFVTHQSLVPVPASVFEHWSDKFLHFGAWMVLAIALGFAFPKVKPYWLPFILLFGYSTGIEFGQIFVPGRSFSGLDIVANGTGCGAGFYLVLFWLRKRLRIIR